MSDLSKWSINDLKNAIWVLNNQNIPKGGDCNIEDYRKELIFRGEDGKGYHEE